MYTCIAACKLQSRNTKQLVVTPCRGLQPQIYRQFQFISKPRLNFKDSEKYLLDYQQCKFSFTCSYKHAFQCNEMCSLDFGKQKCQFSMVNIFPPFKITSFFNWDFSSKPQNKLLVWLFSQGSVKIVPVYFHKGEANLLHTLYVSCIMLNSLPELRNILILSLLVSSSVFLEASCHLKPYLNFFL